MPRSYWHRCYTATVEAPPDVVFDLLADLPNYGRWLPRSDQYGTTTEVEPYPVRLGSRYHDGRPDDSGRDWWGTVTGYQPPGSLDFHQTIRVSPLLSTVDVRIHYSLEPVDAPEGRVATRVNRWLVLEFRMPVLTRPARALATRAFDRENRRVLAALAEHLRG